MGFLNFLKNGIKRLYQGGQAASRGIRKTSFIIRHLKAYALIAFLLLYLIFSVVIHINGTTVAYGDLFEDDGGHVNTSVYDDAANQLAHIRNMEVELSDLNSVYMDNKTAERILEAVAAYNEEVARFTRISYEYRTYWGRVQSFDPVTGAVVMGPVIETSTRTVRRPCYSNVSVADVRIQQMITAGVIPGDTDRDGYVSVPNGYEEIEITVENEIEPREESCREEMDINRATVDADSAHFGEDVFYLRWQPVFTLCAMFIQDNVEHFGEYEDEVDEDGISYFLSNQDLQNIIDVFSFKYTFYDDVTVDGVTDVGFDRILNESAGYRLETEILEGGLESDGATQICVRRMPSIAPRYIYNSYLTYKYEYEQLENGYYEMVERESRLDGQSFLAACNELIEDFDAELFVELLSNLPETEELVDYYSELIRMEQPNIYITRDALECPAVGTYVSTVTGFAARLFNRNGASDSIANVLNGGAYVVEHGYEIPTDALSDEAFVSMFEVAEGCLGTPYSFGGNGGPGISFDCSSFVSYVIRQCGYPVGRETTISLLGYCTEIPAQEARPGDIIFFQGTYRRGVSHVGIWLGNGKFIHASSGAGEVVISDYVAGGYYDEHFLSFGRLP